MSVRTEPPELSRQLQTALTITPEMMAASQPAMVNARAMVQAPMTAAPADALATEQRFHQANDFNTINEHHPLERTVCINIRASLSDLCLRADTATWAPPSAEATKSIFQQRKFLDLGGSAENQGDLKSVVLHKITMGAHKSTFPIALGVRMTGVDDSTFSQTGESYSMIAMPNADSHNSRVLQEDNADLAYEFARKFPNYTAENLGTKGIDAVNQRRFCLVSSDHPLVSAISENADKLQVGEISVMNDGLIKISSGLYETLMPMVKQQVESQIKVRDLSRMSVSIMPADYTNWHDVRTELMSEAKTGFKARVEAELAAAQGKNLDELKACFEQEERAIEHAIDHRVHTFSALFDVTYNFLSH